MREERRWRKTEDEKPMDGQEVTGYYDCDPGDWEPLTYSAEDSVWWCPRIQGPLADTGEGVNA